jgi:hypothetical protein
VAHPYLSNIVRFLLAAKTIAADLDRKLMQGSADAYGKPLRVFTNDELARELSLPLCFWGR